MKTAIVNIGQIVTGDWKSPLAGGNAILTDGERIISVGTVSAQAVEAADVVIDAGGMTAIPGAGRDQARRHRRGPQPQHVRDHAQGPCRIVAGNARLLDGGALRRPPG